MESTLTSWGRLDPPRLRADVPRPAAGVVHRCRVRRAPRHVDLARGGGPPRGLVRLTVLSGSARRSFRVSPSLDLYFRLGKPWHRGLGASTESLDGFGGAGVAAPAVPRVCTRPCVKSRVGGWPVRPVTKPLTPWDDRSAKIMMHREEKNILKKTKLSRSFTSREGKTSKKRRSQRRQTDFQKCGQ